LLLLLLFAFLVAFLVVILSAANGSASSFCTLPFFASGTTTTGCPIHDGIIVMSGKVRPQRTGLLPYFAKLCSLRELCVKAFAFAFVLALALAFASVIPEGNLLLLLPLPLTEGAGAFRPLNKLSQKKGLQPRAFRQTPYGIFTVTLVLCTTAAAVVVIVTTCDPEGATPPEAAGDELPHPDIPATPASNTNIINPPSIRRFREANPNPINPTRANTTLLLRSSKPTVAATEIVSVTLPLVVTVVLEGEQLT